MDIPKLVDFVEGYQSALTVLEYFRDLESVSSVVSEMLVQSFPDDGNSSIGHIERYSHRLSTYYTKPQKIDRYLLHTSEQPQMEDH